MTDPDPSKGFDGLLWLPIAALCFVLLCGVAWAAYTRGWL